jgi:FkbM family methyltransferase
MKTKFNVGIFGQSKIDFINPLFRNDLKYALFPNDNAVSSSIINGWQYEPYLFEFLRKNLIETTGKMILDVGANNGAFAVDFSHLVGDTGRVVSFEPQRLIYYQLCGNVFMNGIDNVYCYNYAIGDSNDLVRIQTPNYYEQGAVNFGNVMIDNSLTLESDLVEQKRLDDFESEHEIVFIKIDVQGYEPNVIRGGENTINKFRPYLFVEFEEHLLVKNNSSEEQLKKQIEDLGYVVKRFQDGIPYQTESGKCLDCVCIPIEKNPETHIIP